MINIEKFLFLYEEREFKPLVGSARGGLIELLGFINADEHMADSRWQAYSLATTFHECAGKWQPIAEFDKGKGRKYGVPVPPYQHVYYGRGLTQNTWIDNYRMLTEAWNKAHPDRPVDFVKNPDLLLQMEYSYWALSYAMRKGAYTGVGLKKYFNDTITDPINARKIINSLDCAERIAGYYEKFHKILKEVSDGVA